MNLLQNLQRTLEDAYEKAQLVEKLSLQLEIELKEAKQRNMALQNALCRCRDMIEDLMKAGSPNQLEHDAKIYLGILEGLIDNKVIEAYPHYSTSLRASLREKD